MELHVDIFNKKENHLIGAFNLTKHFLQALVNIGEVVNFHLSWLNMFFISALATYIFSDISKLA